MDKFKKHIDNLVSKVLNEEIESKVRKITETMRNLKVIKKNLM